MTNDHGQGIAIHLMYAPIYDKISHRAECDQKVHAKKGEIMVEQEIKAV